MENMAAASSGGNSSYSHRHHRYSLFACPKKARYILETESTEAQTAAEDECAPFFIDLPSLPEEQLDHLRSVGLLPPLPLVLFDGENDDDDDDNVNKSNEDGATAAIKNHLQHDEASNSYDIRLLRDAHISYLSNALSNPLSKGYVSLDASHPWMVYWCLHSLDLLGYFDDADANNCATKGGPSIGKATEQWVHDAEIIHKRTMLQRIVSTLQHCYMDIELEFVHEEIVSDRRLKELFLEAQHNHDSTVVTTDTSTKGGNNASCCSNESSQFKSGRSPEKRTAMKIMGGGFGGGPQQLPHVATTYAAVLALSIVAGIGMTSLQNNNNNDDDDHHHHPYHEPGKLALELLNKIRLRLYAFFLSLREQSDWDTHTIITTNSSSSSSNDEERKGRKTAFRMQHDGEIDVRASYCILAPCYLLGLLNKKTCEDDDAENDSNTGAANDTNPLLCPSIPQYVASCQTFEGGFGAEPFNEAHGGYTFCALAALRILNAIPLIDVDALSSWLARRQMSYEGGFSGRTNKLVDGCYSFWQGGAMAVLDSWIHDNYFEGEGFGTNPSTFNIPVDHREILFDELMLQRYILLCAQDINGGLRDKPSKPKDFYHSCYNLSGLSVSQHVLKPWPALSIVASVAVDDGKEDNFNNLFGDTKTNIIGRTDPVINIREERVQFMLDHRQ